MLTPNSPKPAGAYHSNTHHNLFVELLGKSPSQVQTKLNDAWNQLIYGDNNTQRVYYTVNTDMAYIKDILHNNVCSEGMSYGMMIAVQLNKKTEFDCLWKWAKTYMQHDNGPRKDYFAWLLNTDGTIIDPNSASDGEEWLVMALFFASARWGNGTGIYNYRAEAQAILDAMLTKETPPGDELTSIFNKAERQVVFAPVGTAAAFTDPSYHLPGYYELWGRWADKDNQFWFSAASISRQLLKNVAHPITGLTPDYAKFDGTPVDFHNGGHNDFRFDAWRVAMNVAVDYAWFAKNNWAVTQSNRLLDFFHAEGVNTYGNQYTLDVTKLSNDHSPGLTAMNAVACLASTNNNRIDFVQELWNTPIPSGSKRYYDGMLYMLAMLHLSGNFRIYSPAAV
jgi:oligosaccharide reducing-end xylanase